MQPASAPTTAVDATSHFGKRKRTALWFTISLLVVSLFILTIGLTATTRTENITVGGYYPGIILGFGSFLGVIGIHLVENRKQMLVASIVFISFGVVAAFCCAIVDGVFAARHIEPRPLYTGRCTFYASGSGLAYDTQQTEVTCSTGSSPCQLRIRTHTCYCCDLCENSDEATSYYEFIGVNSCQDVVHLYRLLWTCTILNIVGLFLGIITAAVIGAFKDMPSGSYPATSSADISLSDDIQNPSHSNSMNGFSSNLHSQYASTILLPGEKPPPYAP
ncbi:transmembrane protein 255B isoform X2 [Engystomops pustulosus]|uniref:transmembrane protein 255B isoform X2 n=1 Tax=Engystomops pustulosus TaxID=76066 RepID=UPI003AFA2CC0